MTAPKRFEPGAPAGDDFIPLCVPDVSGNEWKYIKECLDTGWVSSVGKYVDRFEADIAAYLGRKYAVATTNGTAALHIALLIAGVKPEDEVLVSTLTFVAPVNTIRYVGAWPVFIDAEAQYWQMDVRKVEKFLTEACTCSNGEVRNRVTGRRVSAILPVHILGHSVDLDPMMDLSRRFGLPVIEDATESLGAVYNGRMVGGVGQTACLSFNGNKLLTTGGGGMLVTDDKALADKARYLTTQAKDDPIEYIHHHVGYNYRLSNIQAAMGVAQLEQINRYLEAKRRIADTYAAAFSGIPGISLPQERPGCRSSWWLYTIIVDPRRFGMDRKELMTRLVEQKIMSRPLWFPTHRLTPFAGSYMEDISVANELQASALSLPCSSGLTVSMQERVIAAIRSLV